MAKRLTHSRSRARGLSAAVAQAGLEDAAAAISELLKANERANVGSILFPFREDGRAARPENIGPFEERAAARRADPQTGGESVYQVLASESWREQQAALQQQLVGMGRGDLDRLDVILSDVEAFWLAAGFELSHITLRRALGWELLRKLDWTNDELRRSLLVFLSMNHCAKGEQVITDGNLCADGCCLSTGMTFRLLERAYAKGGFGPDGVTGVVLTFNGTPVCERALESGCGCAAPKRGDETDAVKSFIAFQLALMQTFLGDDVLTAAMVAYTPHADPATTGLAVAVPVGSVTLSQPDEGSKIEVTVGLPHPAGINNDVACAMGTGGDQRREASREAAKARVIDDVLAVDRWAAALAAVRHRRPPVGASGPPRPVSLAAVGLAVPRPADIKLTELKDLFINPGKASGEGGPSHACARRSGRRHERRAVQVSGASTAEQCSSRVAAARVSADIRPEVPCDTPTFARTHTARAERRARCRAPRRARAECMGASWTHWQVASH